MNPLSSTVKSVLLALSSVVLLAGAPAFADDTELENKAEETTQETEEATQEAAHETEEFAENAAQEDTEEAAEAGGQAFQNGWREGKLETAFLFNEHLNNFDIDVEVDGETAYLSGTVSSEVDVDLAEEVAMSVEGISQVENNLAVSETAKADEDMTESEFLTRVRDATITARIKTQLLANDNVAGMDIDVDTEGQVVTLKGQVSSEAAKDLAEQIARNASRVKEVNNELNVL